QHSSFFSYFSLHRSLHPLHLHSFPTRRSADLTDLSLRHEFGLSKENEKLRLGLEWNVFNVLNQHAQMGYYVTPLGGSAIVTPRIDRKSTRLNSSHRTISYAVFCLKKKKKTKKK